MASLQLLKTEIEGIKNTSNFILNKSLKKKIYNEFEEKKLNENVLALYLYNEDDIIEFEEINILELIAIVDSIRDEYGLSLKKFFTDKEIESYINYAPIIDEINTNELIFKNVSRYNDQLYYCTMWKPSDMAMSKENKLVRYNFSTQRDATISIDRYGNVRKKITLNRENVEGIKESILKNEYFPPDTISLNIPLIKGKIPNVMYDEEKRELKIKINYKIDDENFTAIDIIDGWHRYTAIYELFNELREKNKNINNIFNGFPCQISLTTIEEASKFVYRQTLASVAKTEYTQTVIDNKYNKFIKKINLLDSKESNILYDNIANTFELMKVENKITYFGILEKTLKFIEDREKIDFGNLNEQIYGIKDFKTIINVLTLRANENEVLRTSNIFVGFLALYAYVRKNNLSEDQIVEKTSETIDKLLMTNESKLDSLKLYQKNTDFKHIYMFFESLI